MELVLSVDSSFLKLSDFSLQKAAAPKRSVKFFQKSIGAIRCSPSYKDMQWFSLSYIAQQIYMHNAYAQKYHPKRKD